MSEAQTGGSGRPGGRRWLFLAIVWTVAILCGLIALGFAWRGWSLEFALLENASLAPRDPISRYVDLVVRSIRVLLLSDIYYGQFKDPDAKWHLEIARAFGVAFSLLIGLRILFYAIGAHASDFFFRLASRDHHVIIGAGQAAQEYAAAHTAMFARGRAIHIAEERAPTTRRIATFARRGLLKTQLRDAVAHRAARIVVDAGDDADTWQTAQAIARDCPKAEVLAHITDPWIRDRLSREEGKPGLAAFSYAGGAARQVMLAHPPFLLAERLGAPAQHILIIGFGQVGQSIAREFIVTSVMPGPAKLMITVVDPEADQLEADFESRHEDLLKAVEFKFLVGDFRLKARGLFDQIGQRNGAVPFCSVYIAIDLDHRPLALALALRAMSAQKGLFRAPIFLCAQHGAGLPSVHQGAGLLGGAAEEQVQREADAMVQGKLCNLRLVSFGSWPAAFDGAGLLETRFDGQARRFHEQYEKLRLEQARAVNPDIVYKPGKAWERLEDQFRVSNRRVAAHLRAKAKAVGFDLGDWLECKDGGWKTHDLPPAGSKFVVDDPAFMRAMAEFEHTRWTLDRYLDGWQYGAKRDNYARRRPELVPFDKLDPANVNKDDEVIKTTKMLMDGTPTRGRRGR